MADGKHLCRMCGKPEDVVGAFGLGYALCGECRKKVARQDNADAIARQEGMNRETEPHP